MKNKNSVFAAVIALTSFVLILQTAIVSANANTYTQTNAITNAGQFAQASFVVQALKYQPYPVTPGGSFTLWLQAQNVGQSDAQNAQFSIINSYPFSSNDPAKDYGIVPGTASAYQFETPNDAIIQANQVVMEFHISVASDAPEGIQNLRVQASTSNSSNANVYYIPIDIEKTKTTFDIKVNQITPQESDFVIMNTGDNSASSVTVAVPSQPGISFLSGYQPSALGPLNSGDFTLAQLKVVPQRNAKDITLEISYTDAANNRQAINETVPLSDLQLQNICVQPLPGGNGWAYAAVGFLAGAFIVAFAVLAAKKRKSDRKG